jgi:neurofibromin 1
MIYSILVFLDASPLTIFTGAQEMNPGLIQYFDAVVASFMGFLVTDDERIRYLTNRVACKLLNHGSVALWRRSQTLGPQTLKNGFWKST